MTKRALILIDIQNDFFPGGALAVQNGDEILPTVNKLLEEPFNIIIATKDWHPKGHKSFASSHNKNPGETIELSGHPQILWPDHCVQETKGSEFPPALDDTKIDKIFYKGTDLEIDSYSAFFDNHRENSTNLAEYLQEQGIEELYFVGLATDYCVKFSVLDALDLGFTAYVVEDGCRAVNLDPMDGEKALREMESNGAKLISSTLLCSAR